MKSLHLNRMVQIKLTDYGRYIATQDPRWARWKVYDDWTEVQLWVVMAQFGPFISEGGELPFETTIRVEDDAIVEVE